MKGFTHRILQIDAGEQSFTIEDTAQADLGKNLGGKGLATRLLLDRNPAGVDPFAPENHLIIAVGPATDSPIYGSCRHGVFTKSPQTGFYSESYSGGKAALSISRTGYDAIVIRGASAEPVFLEISDKAVRFHPARDLWGRDTYATEDEVLRRLGKTRGGPASERAAALVIGPAGENLVRFALIENDYWRSAGRTGTGAVLGAKKIKALCFHGSTEREVAYPEEARAFSREILERGKEDRGVQNYRAYGTPMMVALLNTAGAFPSRYWSQGRMEGWEKIDAASLHERCDVKPNACARCFIACGRLSKIKEGPYQGMILEGPEYETIYALGGLCLIGSIEEIIRLNDICDRLGLDTITAGNLAGLAIEASLRGKIKEKLGYGDADAVAEILHKIAYRRGIGATLAEGIVHAASEWGLSDIAIHVKGMEPAGYDPRLLKGMGLAYATSDRGACHLRTTFYKAELSKMIDPDQIEDKAELLADFEDRCCLFDALIICRFYRDLYGWQELSRIIHATTGVSLGKEELREVAGLIISLTHEFNIREGWQRNDDLLPSRLHREPLPETGKVITKNELNRLLADYYRLRGWG